MATLNENGLSIDTLDTIITNLENGFKEIYGNDIVLTSDSPTGQRIALFAQAVRDAQELIYNINQSFDPDQASGVILDQRVSINGIQRQNGTFTYQDVQVTVDRALSLQGLDSQASNLDGTGFTVSDNNGQKFILLDSQDITIPGTYTYSFRASELGAISTLPNTITNIETIVIGVTSVNNSTGVSTLGINEELDSTLRQRRKDSVAKSAQAYIDTIYSNILNVTGVVDCKVYENDTSATDADGLLPHSMYAIVEGGADTDIANVIYNYKTMGCDMNGDTEVDITNANNGKVITIKFDRPQSVNLYIKFDIKATKLNQSFNLDGIKTYLSTNLIYKIGAFAETASITLDALDAINATSGGGVPLNVQISSDNLTWTDYLDVSELKDKWSVNNSNISITVL